MITSSLRAEKFEVVKERYAMETRKIVRGIILAVLLVCTVFLIYSIVTYATFGYTISKIEC